MVIPILAVLYLVAGLAWRSLVAHPALWAWAATAIWLHVRWGQGALIAWAAVGVVLAGLWTIGQAQEEGGIWRLLGAFGRSVAWGCRHPVIISALAATGWAVYLAGPLGVAVLWVWMVACGLVWRTGWPVSWETQVVARARAGWRTFTIYWPRWDDAMEGTKLRTKLHPDGNTTTYQRPKRLRVRSTKWADTVTARLLPGQSARAWEDVAEGLAASFGAEDLQVRRRPPEEHAVDLVVRRGDALAQVHPVLAPAPLGLVDVEAIPIGVTELGEPLTVSAAVHALTAGSSGSGKGSVAGSKLTALAPLIHAGLVRVRCCDPKSGLELALYEDLFYDFAYEPETMADLFDRAVADMKVRANRLRGHVRKFTLSKEDPLDLVLVDEIAEIVYYQPDRKLRERCTQALSILLSQGRAPGTVVDAYIQDPRKETIPFRDLFIQRTGLRLPEEDITKALLGKEAWQRGARCEEINPDTPGVGFLTLNGVPEPTRFRATWPDDTHIRQLAARYPAPHRAVINTTATPVDAEPVVFDTDAPDDLDAWAA